MTRKFDADVHILPEGIGEGGYGMFIGHVAMRKYDMDTSMRTDTITLGEHLAVGMVPRGHWDEKRLIKLRRKLENKLKVHKPGKGSLSDDDNLAEHPNLIVTDSQGTG